MSARPQVVTTNWPSNKAANSASDLGAAAGPQRILVADDSEPIRTLMADVLPTMGYAVTLVGDGHTALEELQRSKPHLVLLDIEMPGLDGCEVCRQIKGHPKTRNIPVILVSGRSDTSDRAAGAGADSFLQKPFQFEDLLGQLHSLLGPRAVRTEGTR